MAAEPDRLIDAVTSRYANARNIMTRLSDFFGRATFNIRRGSPEETIAAVAARWPLGDEQRRILSTLGENKAGAVFIDEKVQDINREAFHRSAFALNALAHLLFVDLGAQLFLSLPQLKLALVGANLVLATVAHFAMRRRFRELLAGPNALPPKRRFWGLARNPRYNRAVKQSSRPYAQSARRESALYRPAYFFNAGTIFFGAQFILPPERIIFPFGFILGKISGLLTTIVALFDVWRAFKAGDDARLAREREVAVYRDLNI